MISNIHECISMRNIAYGICDHVITGECLGILHRRPFPCEGGDFPRGPTRVWTLWVLNEPRVGSDWHRRCWTVANDGPAPDSVAIVRPFDRDGNISQLSIGRRCDWSAIDTDCWNSIEINNYVNANRCSLVFVFQVHRLSWLRSSGMNLTI